MAEEKCDLRQELIKIIVDKLLIGIILSIMGIWATNLVEALKSERSFKAELNKTRVEKIGEVWEKVNIFDANNEGTTDELNKALRGQIPGAQSPEDQIKKIFQSREESYLALKALINKNRFWLGEESYREIKEFIEISNEYVTGRIKGSGNGSDQENQLLEKMNRSRATILLIRDKLLSE
jgi:hypothetical protein